MSEPFIGEIRMFAGNFPPQGWAFCDGQLLAVSQNDALFSLLGTIYGGDGRTTFGLPDLRGRIPIHAGNGPGLSQRRLGARAGSENVTLTVNQIPTHKHALQATSGNANTRDLAGKQFAAAVGGSSYSTGQGRGFTAVNMNADAVTKVGGSQSHTNLQPTLCISFIIALVGIYPSRQ